jgi:hypothetical protein
MPWFKIDGYPDHLKGQTFWNGVLLNDVYAPPPEKVKNVFSTFLDSVPLTADMISRKKVRIRYGHYLPANVSTGAAFALAREIEDGYIDLAIVEPLFVSSITLTAEAAPVQTYDAKVNSLVPTPIAPVAQTYDAKVNSLVPTPIAPSTCASHTTQSACEGAGCYWYDNSCHSVPNPSRKATLNGTVRSIFGAMAGATVTLDGKSAVTAGDGSFSITGIAKGTYTLTIQPAGLFGFFLRPYVTDYSITYPTTYNEEFSLSLDPIKAGMLLGGIGLGVGGVIAVSTGKKKDGGGGGKGYGFR